RTPSPAQATTPSPMPVSAPPPGHSGRRRYLAAAAAAAGVLLLVGAGLIVPNLFKQNQPRPGSQSPVSTLPTCTKPAASTSATSLRPGSPSSGSPSPGVELDELLIFASQDKATLLTDLARDYGARQADGRCMTIRVEARNSGKIMKQLTGGWKE